jgi:hypothetical protein
MNETGSGPVNEVRLDRAVFVRESGNATHAIKSYIETGNSKIEIRKSTLAALISHQPRATSRICHSERSEESRQL